MMLADEGPATGPLCLVFRPGVATTCTFHCWMIAILPSITTLMFKTQSWRLVVEPPLSTWWDAKKKSAFQIAASGISINLYLRCTVLYIHTETCTCSTGSWADTAAIVQQNITKDCTYCEARCYSREISVRSLFLAVVPPRRCFLRRPVSSLPARLPWRQPWCHLRAIGTKKAISTTWCNFA